MIAEMPGVEEKDIKINIEGKKLTFSAEIPRQKYQREIELDYPVKGEFEKDYKNGILELTLKKE